jgi:adenylate cyclase
MTMTGTKATLFCLAVGLVGTFVGALPISLNFEENVGLHLLFTIRGPVNPPEGVVVVTIGRDTANQLDLPAEVDRWPRKMHAQLIERLQSAGAALIAFDLIFDEPQTPEDDLALGHAIAEANNVILAQALIHEHIPVTDRQGDQTGSLNLEKLVSPITCLGEPAIAEAPFPLPKIPICLHQYWTFKPGAGDIPTLPVVVFHAYAGEAYAQFIQLLANDPTTDKTLLSELTDNPSLEKMLQHACALRGLFQAEPERADRLLKSLDDLSQLSESGPLRNQIKSLIDLYRPGDSRYLNFYGPAGRLPTIPYHHIVAPQNAASPLEDRPDLAGKVVFVGLNEGSWGQSTDGYYTVFSTPDGTDINGVEIAATAFANLLEHRPVRHLSPVAHSTLIFAWGLLIAFTSLRVTIIQAALVLLGLGGFYLWGAVRLFASEGMWLPLTVPLGVQMPMAYAGLLVHKYRVLSRERQNIRKAFGYYLPDTVVDQLAKNIDHLNEGQVLYGICLFTDAEKYTSLSETMDPVQLTRLMNQYYDAIFQPIRENDGIVLQVVGDSVLSIWPSPRPDRTRSINACKAALAIDAAMHSPQEAGSFRLPTRTGLHAGEIVMGNIGAVDHFEYRPVGDIVNTASRLEGLNKQLGTRILVSADILAQGDEFLTREVGTFVFIGKSKPLVVYELVAPAGSGRPAQLSAYACFAEGLSAFKSRSWNKACHRFEEAIRRMGADGPSRFYLEQCEAYRQDPPGAEWDGAIVLKQK